MFIEIVTYCKHFIEGDLRAYRNVQWMVLLLVDPISRIDRRPLLSAAEQKRHNAEDGVVFSSGVWPYASLFKDIHSALFCK